jgi:hypothetical protein
MSLEPQNQIVFHPWGCACSIVIEGDFVTNGTKQIRSFITREGPWIRNVLNVIDSGTNGINGTN